MSFFDFVNQRPSGFLSSTVEERGRGGVCDTDVGRRARVRVPAVRPAAPPAHTRTFKSASGQPLRQVRRQVLK